VNSSNMLRHIRVHQSQNKKTGRSSEALRKLEELLSNPLISPSAFENLDFDEGMFSSLIFTFFCF
jgi:hypothetical protein